MLNQKGIRTFYRTKSETPFLFYIPLDSAPKKQIDSYLRLRSDKFQIVSPEISLYFFWHFRAAPRKGDSSFSTHGQRLRTPLLSNKIFQSPFCLIILRSFYYFIYSDTEWSINGCFVFVMCKRSLQLVSQ